MIKCVKSYVIGVFFVVKFCISWWFIYKVCVSEFVSMEIIFESNVVFGDGGDIISNSYFSVMN